MYGALPELSLELQNSWLWNHGLSLHQQKGVIGSDTGSHNHASCHARGMTGGLRGLASDPTVLLPERLRSSKGGQALKQAT